MERGIEKSIKLLEEVKNLITIQKERGVNTFREEMIERMLFDVQQEIVHALAENARKQVP